MNKTTTNLLLMLITVVAGTYFYIMYCSECGKVEMMEPSTARTKLKPETVRNSFSSETSGFNYATNKTLGFSSYTPNEIMLNKFQPIDPMSKIEVFLKTNENSKLNMNGVFTRIAEPGPSRPKLELIRQVP